MRLRRAPSMLRGLWRSVRVGLWLRSQQRGPGLPRAALLEARRRWGSTVGSADLAFLERALELMPSSGSGPVLECGSGLSTVVAGLEAQRTGRRIVTLEHDAYWYVRTWLALKAAGLRSVTLRHAPLTQHAAGFRWYGVDRPETLSDVSFVMCDGPPALEDGTARYGLLPVMLAAGAADFVVLLDDVHRPGERTVVERWTEIADAEVAYELGDGAGHAILKVSGAARG